MNFYELFEKKDDPSTDEKEHQEVTIADPKAAVALKQARAKYTYAKSDLEAFVKMTQDKEEEEDAEIAKLDRETEKLEKETDRQEAEIQQAEKEIKDLENKEAMYAGAINKLKQENDLQDKLIKSLQSAKKEFTTMADEYDTWAQRISNDLLDLENRLRNVKGFVPGKLSSLKTPGSPKKQPPPDFSIPASDV